MTSPTPKIAALALTLALGACAGPAPSPSAQATGSPIVTPPPPAVTALPAATAAAPAAPATAKVSANNATIPQLTAAFQAAGIPQADRWAREVDEYRPYATTDTTFTKLRGQLAKYNPSADVVTKITATLGLP